MIQDVTNVTVQPFFRLSQFSSDDLILVNVHQRQADVGVGHQQREDADSLQMGGTKVALHDVDGLADVVACGTKHPTVMAFGIADPAFPGKLPHRHRWPPGVYWEAKADGLAGLQRERLVDGSLTNRNQRLAQGLANPLGSPCRIACTRIVENHIYSFTTSI